MDCPGPHQYASPNPSCLLLPCKGQGTSTKRLKGRPKKPSAVRLAGLIKDGRGPSKGMSAMVHATREWVATRVGGVLHQRRRQHAWWGNSALNLHQPGSMDQQMCLCTSQLSRPLASPVPRTLPELCGRGQAEVTQEFYAPGAQIVSLHRGYFPQTRSLVTRDSC